MQTTEADAPEAHSPVIETSDLTMRLVVRDDIPDFLPYVSREDVSRYTSRIPHPYTPADAEAYIGMVTEAWQRNRSMHCTIRRRDGAAFVGVMLLELEDDTTKGEIGYWIAPPFWGKGYGTRAARSMILFGFETVGLEEIHARVAQENSASLRLMEKLGMRPTGQADMYFPARGRTVTVRKFSLTRENWMKDNG